MNEVSFSEPWATLASSGTFDVAISTIDICGRPGELALKNVWIVTCEGNPVAAYTEESEANLFAIRASGLMQIGGFKVSQVHLYEPETKEDRTVFTPPMVPSVGIVSPYV